MNIRDIEARFAKARADKEVWDSLYYNVYRMTMPNRNSFYQDDNIPNDWQNTSLLTSAGANAADAFASRFQRILSTDGESAITIESPLFSEDTSDSRAFVGNLSKAINKCISANLSKMLETGYDLVAGTGFYFKYYSVVDHKFAFIPVPTKDICITRDFKGEVDGYYRLIKCKREEAPSMYREITPDTKLGGVPTTKENAQQEIELHEATIYNYDDGLWHFYVIHGPEILVDRKSITCPFGCVSWTRRPGSDYGIGVGVKALPELNQLNTLRYYGTFGVMFRSAPMFLVSQDSMLDFDRLEMKPLELIPVPSTGRDNPSIAPLQLGDDPNTNQWSQQQIEMNIKETMLSDTIPNQTNQKMTATEISARVNRLNVITNQMVAVAQEMLTDVTKWLLWEFRREQNVYPEDFDIRDFIDGCQVKLTSTAVRNSEAIQALATMVDLFNVASPDGSLTQIAVNQGEFANKVRDLLKVDENIVLPTDEILENKQAMAQAQQEQAVAQQRAQMAREIAVEQFKNGQGQL